MASVLCSTNCGATADPQASYWDQCDGNTFRKYAYPYMALMRCDLNLPDPNDLTAWETAFTNGAIQLLPCGKVTLPAPTVETSEDVNVCGGATVLSTTYNVTFETYQTAEDYTDGVFYKNFLRNHSNYRVMWFDCNSVPYMSGEYADFVNGQTVNAPVGAPGFEFTVSAPPHPVEGDGQRQKWEFTIEIELDGQEIICGAPVPGLLAALQA